MDNILSVGGTDCTVLGVAADTSTAAVEPSVWTLLALPVLFFILTFIFKGNIVMGVLTIISASVIAALVIDYDPVYALILVLIIIGTALKLAKETITKGAQL